MSNTVDVQKSGAWLKVTLQRSANFRAPTSNQPLEPRVTATVKFVHNPPLAPHHLVFLDCFYSSEK